MSETPKPLYVALTLDIDPDANVAVAGRVDAVSPPVEKGEARVEATHRGLEIACEALRRHEIAATFFYEARTAQMLAQRGAKLTALSEGHEVACHSLKHEDFL
ncbi:MAG: hypothetical protein FJ279_36120, partial [Planctomycetes bacterium]|nr:hypothetical protein [Planctomycetota bacterium]